MLRIDWIYSTFQGYKSRKCSLEVARFLDFHGAKKKPIEELWHHFNKLMNGEIRPFPITFHQPPAHWRICKPSFWVFNFSRLLRNEIEFSMSGVYLFCDNGTEGYCVRDAWSEIVKNEKENKEQKSAYHKGEDEHYFKYFFSFCYNQIASGIELWDGPEGPRIDKGLYLSKVFEQYFPGNTKGYRKFLKDCLPGIETGKEFLEEWITDNLPNGTTISKVRPLTLGYMILFKKLAGDTSTDAELIDDLHNEFNTSTPGTITKNYQKVRGNTSEFHRQKPAFIDEAIKLLKNRKDKDAGRDFKKKLLQK